MKILKLYLFVCIILSNTILAADFTVNSFDDLIDINPGDGICEATVSNGDCTLRAAIIETNILAGNDNINIPAGTFVLSITGDDDAAFMGDLDVVFVDLTITGAGMNQTIIDGAGIDRIFYINQSNVTIQDLTLQNGGDVLATVSGGGLMYLGRSTEELILNRVKIDNNRANGAGGMFIGGIFTDHAFASINDSILSNNDTTELGIINRQGPAINCRFCELKINATTISHNGIGGNALRVETGSLEMLNSTISNNQQGGVRSTNSNMLIKFSTIFENGGQNLSFFSFDDTHVFEVGYSVLQTSTNDNCQTGDIPTSIGYNVTSDSTCNFTMTGDSQTTDAQLGLLTDNGGTSQTHLPAISSPLINQVPLSECLDLMAVTLMLDQRGFVRPFDSLCDIGAVEVNTDMIIINGFE